MGQMFDSVNWLGVALGAVACFLLGWFWYSPKGFYPAWSASAKVTHQQGDLMGAAFGSLTVGLVLYSICVGVMIARGAAWAAHLWHFCLYHHGLFQQCVQKTGGCQPYD